MGFIEPFQEPPVATAPVVIDRHELNRQHRDNPEQGDYWHEIFTPTILVLATWGGVVIYCDRIALREDRSVWVHPDSIKTATREEFARRLSYGTIPDKTWSDVVPGVAQRSARIALGLEQQQEAAE